jgi:hypothetical protein
MTPTKLRRLHTEEQEIDVQAEPECECVRMETRTLGARLVLLLTPEEACELASYLQSAAQEVREAR